MERQAAAIFGQATAIFVEKPLIVKKGGLPDPRAELLCNKNLEQTFTSKGRDKLPKINLSGNEDQRRG